VIQTLLRTLAFALLLSPWLSTTAKSAPDSGDGLRTIATIDLAGTPASGARLDPRFCNRPELVYDVDITTTSDWDSATDKTEGRGLFVLGRNMHDRKPNSVSLLVWCGSSLFARMTNSTMGDTAQIICGDLGIKPGSAVNVHARWNQDTITLDYNGRRIGSGSMAGTFVWPADRPYFVGSEAVNYSPWGGKIISATLRVMEPIIRAGFTGGTDAGFFVGPESHTLGIDFPARDGRNMELALDIVDINGAVIERSLKPSVVRSDKQDFALPELPFGWYQAEVTIKGNGSTLALKRSFVVTPGPIERDSADRSPFGITEGGTLAPAGQYDPAVVDSMFARMAAMGIRWYRLWVNWDIIQTQPGQYDWRQLDDVIARAKSHGISLYLSFEGGSLRWQSWQYIAKPSYGLMGPNCYMPRDLAQWSDYVAAVAKHCRGKVFYYQVWNEPDARNGFYPYRTEDYVRVLKATSEAVRAADSRNRVGLGGFAGGFGPGGIAQMSHTDKNSAWGLGEFWALNPQPYYDVMDCHFYSCNDPGQSWDHHVGTATNLRAAMKTHGDGAKQLWNSETSFLTGEPGKIGGWAHVPLLSGEDQAARLVQMHVQSLAVGIAHTFWYSIRGDCGVLNTDFSPLPSYAAHCELARLLTGMQYDKTIDLGNDLRAYAFTGNHRHLIALWTTAGQASVTVSGDVRSTRVVDMMGNEHNCPISGRIAVSTTPIYLVGSGNVTLATRGADAKGWGS